MGKVVDRQCVTKASQRLERERDSFYLFLYLFLGLRKSYFVFIFVLYGFSVSLCWQKSRWKLRWVVGN